MPDRQLLLLRHAKAVTGEGMQDFDRPLAPRGERAAQTMGRYMAEHGLAPDLVLCSPARRTSQTWEIAARELPPADVRHVGALYDFGDGGALLEVIRQHGGTARRLLLVTHNPAAQHLALDLAGSGDPAQRRQMLEKYPTAGLAVLSHDGCWHGLAQGSCRLDAFARPRDLG
ncbi:histidine phosphatase family protein [Aestuariivirga sp.]|uniref:SixA phosphatase family protein n=1 Tax=Aestuariivirga sp. TaxID=2650926 RepID=UPI0025C69899|nr:histidine phosphatase family protein [Aestuariivirga sp.]MCA3554637.1 histidine phosphatase family protein [Aestuariivirga sp.]